MADDIPTSPSWTGPDYDVPDGQVLRAVQKRRHWKQQYDETAAVVWRRQVTGVNPEGEPVVFPIGSIVPTWFRLQLGRTKLQRFWESRFIELYDFGRAIRIQDEYLPVELPLRGSTPSKPAPRSGSKKKSTTKKKSSRRKFTRHSSTPATTPASTPSSTPSSAKPDTEAPDGST